MSASNAAWLGAHADFHHPHRRRQLIGLFPGAIGLALLITYFVTGYRQDEVV